MKKRIGVIFFTLIVCSLLITLLNENNDLIGIGQVETSQAEQTEELTVKYKTTNSIAISWEDMQIPETVVKYNI